MTTGEEKSAGEGGAAAGAADLYAVLGLKKECTDADLRNAYRKLALRWHPDRCSASGSSKRIEEAKEKFQQIQGAYSVLSDSSKRFLYDVGVYDSDDEDHTEMGEFLGEMAQMMSQIKPSENRQESFEDLQQLFVDMFQADIDSGFCGPQMTSDVAASLASSSPSPPPSFTSASTSASASASAFSFQFCSGGVSSNKRSSSEMNQTKSGFNMPSSATGSFCFGTSGIGHSSHGRGGCSSKRRNERKQRV